MIWMFVTLGLMLGLIAVYLVSWSGDIGRKLENMLNGFMPAVLLTVGACACLSKGSVNLALPGIACMSAFLGSLLLNADSNLAFAAVIVGLFAGALSGVFAGLFTIQSGKRVLAVTALSSLLIGTLLMWIPQAANVYSLQTSGSIMRGTVTAFSVITLLLAAAAAILSGLGRHAPMNTGDSAPRPNGGARFLWSVIAGALAGLAGVLLTLRISYFQPSNFSGYNESTIIPGMLIAGALIPNLRRSAGEGICGGLAALFGGVSCFLLTQILYFTGMDTGVARVLLMVVSVLFLIPNLLIGKRKNSLL